MADNIHIKKFDGGKRTPAEVHRELVFKGQSCSTCGDPVALAAKFMMEDAELRRREPQLYMALLMKRGGDPAFDTKYGKMVVFNVVFACDRCKDGMRKYAAHQPDYVLVEFDEGGLEATYPAAVGGA